MNWWQGKSTWSLKTIAKLVMFLYIIVGNKIEAELKVQCEQKELDSHQFGQKSLCKWVWLRGEKRMHAGCQNASTGLSERLLLTWELCKLTYRLGISNKKKFHWCYYTLVSRTVFSQELFLGSENSILL